MVQRGSSFDSYPVKYVLVLLLVSFNVYLSNATVLTLKDAIGKGLVKAVITGNSRDSNNNYKSSYYGLCLMLTLQSKAKIQLNLSLEAGRFLETADTAEQRMMITQDELIVLKPGSKKSLTLFAMCTQMHDHSPGKESLLTLGMMADGNLLAMAQFIGQNHFQSQAAQQAIWSITDNNDLGSIYSENPDEMNKLQAYASKLTGKIPPPVPHSIFYANGMVSGEIVFENKQRETYSFVMMNEAGEKIGVFFQDKTIDMPLVTTLTWRFRFNGFAKGVYYVELINSKNEVVTSRPLVIN